MFFSIVFNFVESPKMLAKTPLYLLHIAGT